MLGTNDSKEENWDRKLYQKDLDDLVKSYKNLRSNPDIYIMIPPRVLPTDAALVRMKMQPNIVAYDLPDVIKEVASDNGLHVINLLDLFVTDSEDPEHVLKKSELGYWSSDGVHPNDGGYKKIAEYIFGKLNRKHDFYGKLIPHLK